MTALVTISSHTTSSVPRLHIVYTIQVNVDGKEITAQRRYSEVRICLSTCILELTLSSQFAALQGQCGTALFDRIFCSSIRCSEALKDPYNLPSKRLFVTTFIPSAWADDTLIAERKAGLADYLFDVLSTPKYKDTEIVQEFLSGRSTETEQKFDLEDALPSTVTRNKALALASNALDGNISAQAAMIYGSYYTSWSASEFPPEKLDYSKFDILYFGFYIFLLVLDYYAHSPNFSAFVTPSAENTINWGGSSNQDLLRRLVAGARSSGYGTRVLLSIGMSISLE